MRLLVFLAALLVLSDPAQAVRVVPASQDEWTCFDWSTNYTELNPDWGTVTISDNHLFHGVTHIVNYKLVNENVLLIHDGMRKEDYTLGGWQVQGYYHFWINEKPIRNYVVMKDNRNIILSSVLL